MYDEVVDGYGGLERENWGSSILLQAEMGLGRAVTV